MNRYKILLLLAALSQLVSPYISNFNGGSNFNQLLITPAGYTFAIWGLITTFCFLHAFWHTFFDKATYSLNFYLGTSLVYVFFTVWLLVAERSILWATVVIFFAMLYLLQKSFKEVLNKANLKNNWNRIFLQGGLGMYLAWATIATIINVGVFIFSFGIENVSSLGIIIQGLLVAIATANAILALKIYKKNIVLFLTFWWAFVGLLVGLYSRLGSGTEYLIAWTLFCVLLLNLYFFKRK